MRTRQVGIAVLGRVRRAGALLAVASALLLGMAGAAPEHDLAQIERLESEVQQAGAELLATLKAAGLPPASVAALRDLVEKLDRDSRGYLTDYWEGQAEYTHWSGMFIRPDKIRGRFEQELGITLPGDQSVDRSLEAYGEARIGLLQGAMGPGGCHFHLWARIESVDDQGSARVRIGQRSPMCANLASPIALRSVRWRGVTEDAPPRPWRGPLPGISVPLEDGSIEVTSAAAIAHTLDSIPATDAEFERGFLRSGESLELFFSQLPPTANDYVLEIELAVVGDRDLDGPVLFPERKTEFISVYRSGERSTHRDLGGLAFVPWKQGAPTETVRLVRPVRPPEPAP